jgi:hypothetical protein
VGCGCKKVSKLFGDVFLGHASPLLLRKGDPFGKLTSPITVELKGDAD